jgi:hypothetical protein
MFYFFEKYPSVFLNYLEYYLEMKNRISGRANNIKCENYI